MCLESKNLINARIHQVRQRHAGVRGKARFARELGVSPSTYNYYEKDRVPPIEILWKICGITGCDLEWLISGEAKILHSNGGSPLEPLTEKIDLFLKQNPSAAPAIQAFFELLTHKMAAETQHSENQDSRDSDRATQRFWLPILGRTAAGIINYWPDNPNGLPQVTHLAELIQKHQKNIRCRQPSTQVSTDPVMVDVPQLSAEQVSIIQLTEVTEQGVCEFIECPLAVQRYPDAFALRVDGDSMAPHIADGDLVILSPSVPHVEAATAVVKVKNQIGVTCKIVRTQQDKLHLVPINEKVDHQIIPRDQIEWSLAVLWRIRS